MKFYYVKVECDFGFIIVGIKKDLCYEFECMIYCFDMVYGLVKNEVGLLIFEMNFWNVEFDDFWKGYFLVRCLFVGGKFGLLD